MSKILHPGSLQPVAAACLALALAWAPALSSAQGNPRSFVASPEAYKVIAENAQYRVIEVTWKPGARDKLHAHPASAVYYLTDCTLRNHPENGAPMDGSPKAGMARVQPPIAGHSIENIGSTDCKLIMFEPY